jgi:hypothetical protein
MEQEMTLTKKKKIIAIILLLVIFVTFSYTAYRKDDWFKHYQTIRFLGCNETYLNGELITPECSYAREEMMRRNNPTIGWKLNLT